MTKTRITGIISDSYDVPIDGKIEVTLDAPIIIDAISDRQLIPVTASIPVPDGVLDIELEETETYDVTYHFKFYRTVDTEFIETTIDFHEIVPETNGGEISWKQLVPTSISTGQASTGAVRVAREILTNPGLAPFITASIGILKSGDRPPSPIEVANGTIWVSPTGELLRNQVSLAGIAWFTPVSKASVYSRELTATTTLEMPINARESDTDMLIYSILHFYKTGLTDTTNYWTIRPYVRLWNGTTEALTSPVIVRENALNQKEQVLSQLGIYKIDPESFYLEVTKVGSPPPLTLSSTISYSFVAAEYL